MSLCRTVGRGGWNLKAGRYLSVGPDHDPGMWSVTAREYVGTLVVDDMRILIRPKIRLENLFLMLEVGLPEQAWRKEDFDYATNPDLLQSLVSFYARTLETTLARGSLPVIPQPGRGSEGDPGPHRLRPATITRPVVDAGRLPVRGVHLRCHREPRPASRHPPLAARALGSRQRIGGG